MKLSNNNTDNDGKHNINFKYNLDQTIEIPKRYLNLFKDKLKMTKEISGLININLENEINRVIYNISKNASKAKTLNYEPQFEINFHTHPDKGKEVEPPSSKDIASFFIRSLENIYQVNNLTKRKRLTQKSNSKKRNKRGLSRKSSIKKQNLSLKKYDFIIAPEGIYVIPYADKNNKYIKNIYNDYIIYKKSNELTEKLNNLMAKKYGNLINEFKLLKNSIIKEQNKRYNKILEYFHKGNIYKLQIIEEFLENSNNKKLFKLTSNILGKRNNLLNSKTFTKKD